MNEQSHNHNLGTRIRDRLLGSIGACIDMIGHVPKDLQDVAGNSLDSLREQAGSHQASDSPGPKDDRDPNRLSERINTHYDRVFYATDGVEKLIFEATAFKNLGYWDASTPNLDAAAKRLHDTLVDMLPARTGRILDTACGMGASVHRLLKFYEPKDIWAINISAKQIESTLEKVPGCNARVMSAIDMAFEDGFFDNVLCIEAALHFETRRDFLQQAHRVLKSDGCLALSDIIFTSKQRHAHSPYFGGVRNYVASIQDYKLLLEDVGFRNVRVVDVSRDVWGANFIYNSDKLHKAYYAGQIDLIQLSEALWGYYYVNSVFKTCLFAFAQK